MSIRADLDQLLALQALDTERDAALKSRAQIDNGAGAQAQVTKAQAESDLGANQSSQTARELKDAELELASVETKVKSYDQKMSSGTLTNAREIANVEKELHQLHRQRSTLDDKILNLMDQAERDREAATSKAEHLKQAHQLLDSKKSQGRQTLDRLNTEIARLDSNRPAIVQSLSGNPLLTKYESLRARAALSGLAIVKIDSDRHCSGCHLPVSQQYAERVREAASMVTCENCGRILA